MGPILACSNLIPQIPFATHQGIMLFLSFLLFVELFQNKIDIGWLHVFITYSSFAAQDLALAKLATPSPPRSAAIPSALSTLASS